MQSTIKNRTIFCKDNIEVLRGIDSKSIDLVYLDPPFNKKKNFHAPIGTEAEGASFKDTWGMADIKDEWHGLIAEAQPQLYAFLDGVGHVGDASNKYYLIYMAVRLLEIQRILKDTGSMYLHCDPTMSHFLKLLCDTIFGQKNFRNEIVWCYSNSGRAKRYFSKKHDIILFYVRTENYVFDYKIPVSQDYLDSHYRNTDSNGKRCRKRIDAGKERIYYPEEGMSCNDWWEDIQSLNSVAKERVGYPTQKPLALLERIIKASTNEGDVVLDPFCGCATACIAAERLHRQWVGIDVSHKAYNLVGERMKREVENTIDFSHRGKSVEAIFRDDIPQRSDTTKSPLKKKEIKHILYGKQEGRCIGCKTLFHYVNLSIDHIVPQAKGGDDTIENLQLLCGHCNSVKGDRDMAYLQTKLKEQHII